MTLPHFNFTWLFYLLREVGAMVFIQPHFYLTWLFCLLREVAAEDNTGIEGILKGLETHRNVTFGVGMREKGNGSILINNNGDDWHSGNSTNAGRLVFLILNQFNIFP